MRESFMKYDRDNPPAGVDKRGKFAGAGADLIIKVEEGNKSNLAIVSGSYETVEQQMLAGGVPDVRVALFRVESGRYTIMPVNLDSVCYITTLDEPQIEIYYSDSSELIVVHPGGTIEYNYIG